MSSTRRWLQAITDVDFDINSGETLGLVGESGCGKTTVGRSVLRLIEPSSGEIFFDGADLRSLRGEALRTVRKNMQIVFQDPYGSLNPRMNVHSIIGEPLRIHEKINGDELDLRVIELLERVGLPEISRFRFPHEFSGGQRQRIGIARAIALNPKLIVCDEAVSALDVSIQAQILNLLRELQEDLGLAYLFISHDLNVVRHGADRVAVMYLGRIVETADTNNIFENPRHPYTKALVAANPVPIPGSRRKRFVLKGEVPSPLTPPKGCAFHPRCSQAMDSCQRDEPLVSNDRLGQIRCHLYTE
ncbi:ATP-binding cassette domain-containing protein [Myxococcota bacterium]|nr:ATP-binding cassette domain-containing protein [Myxococcota bacterium]